MTSGTRIGILGGTLDPVHSGHVDTALAARDALALDRVLVPALAARRRTGRRSPSASRFHRFAMAALAVNGDRGTRWRATSSLARTGPSYTADTLARLHADAASPRRRFSSSPAPTRSQKSKRGAAIRRCSTWRTSSSSRGRAIRRRRSRRALPALAARMRTAAPRRSAERARRSTTSRILILLVDAPTPDVSSTEIRRRLRSRRIDHRARSRSRRTPTSVSTGFTRAARDRRAAAADHLHGQKLERQRRTERRRTEAAAGEVATRGARRARQEGTRTSSCSTCATRRRSPISSCCARARTRGRSRRSPTRRGSAARGEGAAGARRGLRPRRVGPDGLLHFIVHVFAPQTREFYSLERLWGDAERIEISDEPGASSSAA